LILPQERMIDVGLFTFGKKKEYLLNWQKVVLSDSPDKLIMTEKQLKEATEQQAKNDLRIINDSRTILETTVNPDTFFSRLNLLKDKAKHLVCLEPYMQFTGASPTVALNEVINTEQEAIYNFIIRYFGDVFDKAQKLKTDAGKCKRYQVFYDSLAPYFDKMDERNKKYVEYCANK